MMQPGTHFEIPFFALFVEMELFKFIVTRYSVLLGLENVRQFIPEPNLLSSHHHENVLAIIHFIPYCRSLNEDFALDRRYIPSELLRLVLQNVALSDDKMAHIVHVLFEMGAEIIEATMNDSKAEFEGMYSDYPKSHYLLLHLFRKWLNLLLAAHLWTMSYAKTKIFSLELLRASYEIDISKIMKRLS